MKVSVLNLIERMQSARSADESWKIFHSSMASDYGISGLFYGSFAATAADYNSEVDIWATLPPAYMEHYQAMEQAQHDHLIAHCHHSNLPARWHDSEAQMLMSPESLQVERDAWEFGLTVGITLPLRERHSFMGGMSFVGEAGREAAFETTIARDGPCLYLLAFAFHSEMQKRLRSSSSVQSPLSRREMECLQWAAMGLSAKRIGDRLGIAQKTAEAHLARAKERLGAQTGVHAVAKAIMLGLIEIPEI